jgi:hypothetical protein
MIGRIQIVSSLEILYGSTTGTASNAVQIIHVIADVSIRI